MAQLLISRGAKVGLPAAVGLQTTGDLERLLREDPDCLKPGNRWAHLIVRAGAQGSAARHRRTDPIRRIRECPRRSRHLGRRDARVHRAARGWIPRKSRSSGGTSRAWRRSDDQRRQVFRHPGGMGQLRRAPRRARPDSRRPHRSLRSDRLRSARIAFPASSSATPPRSLDRLASTHPTCRARATGRRVTPHRSRGRSSRTKSPRHSCSPRTAPKAREGQCLTRGAAGTQTRP